MSKPCILFSANPKAIKADSGLSSALGYPDAHVDKLKEHGAVFWDVSQIGEQKNPVLDQVKTGYIYNVPEKAITFKVDIDFIKSGREMDEGDYEPSWEEYVPEFRLNDFPLGDPENVKYWIKITSISRLTKKGGYTAKDFRKYKDGTPFKKGYIRNYGIAIDPEYPSEPYEINPQNEMDEIIERSIYNRKYDEKDIEDILAKRLLRENLEKVHRQPPTLDGRIDIAYTDKNGVFRVIEIKKEADKTALDQIKGYMDYIKNEYKPENMKGIILCHRCHPDLSRAVEKESGIEIKKFRFSIEFDDF